ncbi:caldesmon [Syngnathus scovelli]|uniref:caldesmon n=1 Tax=Syngnathus scovelli TaxID=161590 RepID=UPI00210F384C|nr:trichohyalin [Syngnathus scovelli]
MSFLEQPWCPTSVQVTVLQARGLRAKGKGGTNDAYALIQMGKDKYQTSVVEKSVAPVWKEEAAFELPQQGTGGERGTLHVHVLHRALVGPDKLLGQAVIDLGLLAQDKSRNKTEWFKLLDKSGKSDKDRGEVLVDIQFMRNNMTASMFDLTAVGKPRSRLGKLKDKVRGKKKEPEAVALSFRQVLTDSEEDEDEEESVDGGAGAGEEKKKKAKLKSLFSHKSNLQRNMSQSMSVLPAKNSSLSGSLSSGLNVDASEGKKKFKFMKHKRSGSSDNKEASQKRAAVEKSNLCINGSHVYCEEPLPRTTRIGSNFSLTSSGHGSMEDVPESSPPPVESLPVIRQYTPWEEEEEEMRNEEVDNKEEMKRRKELAEKEKERRRREEEERERDEEKARKEQEEEARRQEMEKRRRDEEEERKREEEERMRREEMERLEEEKMRREEEERVRREELERLEEEKMRREEEERVRREELERLEEETLRREEEERIRRDEQKQLEEEKRREEEEERLRRQELERIEEETLRREEEERKREEEERVRREEEQKRLEEEKGREEERLRRQELERLEEEKLRWEEEERKREEEERIRREEEQERLAEQKRQEEEKLRRQEQERLEEEKLRWEEEQRKRDEEMAREKEEERMRRQEERLAEEQRRLEEERRRNEEKARKEEEERIRLEEEALQEKIRKEDEERARQREQQEEQRRLEERRKEEKAREEERVRRQREEEEEERAKEEERRREEEERKLEEELREAKRKDEELQERQKEEEQKRKLAEEEERQRVEDARREEEQKKLEEEEKEQERRWKDEEEKKRRDDAKSDVDNPQVNSSNPFEEEVSNHPFDDNNAASRSDPTVVTQSLQQPETSTTIAQREKRPAPQPPGRTTGRDETSPITEQVKDKEVKTASVPPQRSVQTIPPRSRSPTDAQKHKRPAPSIPSTESKQEAHSLNPFDDDDDGIECAHVSSSVSWPPPVSQTPDPDAKVKSSKVARAPAPPAKTADVSSTQSNTRTLPDDAKTQAQTLSHRESPPKEPKPSTLQHGRDVGGKKEAPPAPSRRLHPVKPLSAQEQHPVVTEVQVDKKKMAGNVGQVEENTKVKAGPYSMLTREELIALVVKQETQLQNKDRKIAELEQYIDNLLVRIMDEQPSILSSMKKVV